MVAVVFTIVIALAIRRKVLFRLSIYNIARRKSRIFIVIIGLLIGTALISSAMVVGDSVEYIFIEDVLQRWGFVDEVVAQQSTGYYVPFNETYFEMMRADLTASNSPIDGIAPGILQQLTVRNEIQDLWAGPVNVIGINSSFESGFGNLVAVDGQIMSTNDLEPGSVFINERAAEKLGAKAGSVLRVYFSQSSFNVTVYENLRNEGLANLDKRPVMIMDLNEAQNRFQMQNTINFIRISNLGNEEGGAEYSTKVTTILNSIIIAHGWNVNGNLQVEEVKREGIEEARQFGRDITQIFFIMGTFAVVAGILLIINIFVMMAEERKSEMGVSRAIGMTRKQLTQIFVFEGAVYSAISSILGALLGIALGYVVIYFYSLVMPIGQNEVVVTFHYNIDSVILAFSIGILITFFTILIASWWVSRLNIVRAIRDQPEPVPRKTTKSEAIVSVILLIGGIIAILFRSYPPANIASVPLLILGGMILSLRVINPRWTFTAGGIGIMAWTLIPKFLESDYPDIYIPFVLAGLLLVLGGVIFVVFNSLPLIGAVSAISAKRKAYPVLKTAMTYPLGKKFRTGMTLAMFSLIMFAITIISMIQAMQASAVDQAYSVHSGGYDFVAYTTTFKKIDDKNWSQGIQNSGISAYVEGVSNATVVPVFVHPPGGGETIGYTLWGVDNVLVTTNEFGFKATLDHYYDDIGQYHEISTSRDAWNAIAENDGLALVDGNAAGGTQFSQTTGDLRLEVGDLIYVDVGNVTKNFTIIGILQQSLPGTMGLFVSENVIPQNIAFSWSACFFKVNSGIDPKFIADRLKSEFVEYGLETIVFVEVIGQVIETADRVLLLMQAYLGIGLIVGIAGLAVISIRAVVERRQQIGVLRAIGYTKNMIMASFLLEISFMAAFGTAIGIILGVLLSFRVWSLFFQDATPFIIPWFHLAIVALITGIVTILATASPAVRASKIPPAEALRYSE